jgi:hypothetical protein
MSLFKIAIGLAVIAIVSVGVFMVSDVYLSADEPILPGSDVIYHDWSGRFPIENGVKSIQNGQKVEDGCKFTTRLERMLGEPPKIARTLAHKPSTCERIIEKGTLSEKGRKVIREEENRPDGSRESESPESVNPSTNHGKKVPGLPSPLLLPTNEGSFKTRWEDPFGLDVNWLKSWVQWEYA